MVLGWNPCGSETFRTCPDRPWGPPSLLYNGYRVFPMGKERPGRDTDPSPPSSAVVMKGWSYTSTPPMGRTACTDPQCLHSGLCLTTDPQPLAKPVLHKMRSTASSFSLQYPLVSLRSSSSCLRLVPRLLVTISFPLSFLQ